MTRLFAMLLTALLLAAETQAYAIDYTLPDLNGQQHSLSQHRGKWLVVNYWATWCGTCRKELPDLAALHEKYRDQDIVVVGINFEQISQQALQDFVAKQNIPYPVLRSEPVRHTPLGQVPALPTTYIVDPTGKLVAGEVGLVSRQHLEDYITEHRAKEKRARD